MTKKIILTLTGPSGAGKTTLANKLVSRTGFKNVVSHTTREPRQGEVDGHDYHFVTAVEFLKMFMDGGFVESVEFNGKHYGISVAELSKIHTDDSVPVLVLEPEGLHQMSEYCKHNNIKLVSIYVGGDLETLLKRILTRDLSGRVVTDELMSYTSRRICSMTEEIHTWGDAFPYSFLIGRFDEENEIILVADVINMVNSVKESE